MDYEITNDGIGIFDGYFDNEDCDAYIKYFNNAQAANSTWNHGNPNVDDDRVDLKIESQDQMIINNFGNFLNTFWGDILPLYTSKFKILNEHSYSIPYLKIQKTVPGQGYHQWHCEKSVQSNAFRIFAVMMFLNDVEEGGETEFLTQNKRVAPKEGRVVIFPANYTHAHRGNPPLKGDKLILNGWGYYMPNEKLN